MRSPNSVIELRQNPTTVPIVEVEFKPMARDMHYLFGQKEAFQREMREDEEEIG